MKFTKIVATVNASTCTEELIRALYKNGMDVVRLNTAHMTVAEMERVVPLIRAVSDRIAIMIDTKGPNIRTCNLETPLELSIGDRVRVTGDAAAQSEAVQVNYGKFAAEVREGCRIVFDDGAMALAVVGRERGMLLCEATRDGILYNHKSVNVPGAELRTPALTRADREFIDCAVRNNLDFIAHSFVRNAGDVQAVRSILETSDSPIQIVAKIENRQGVDNLDGILAAADGVMVARGDLGIEIPLEEVPLIQKELIRAAVRHGKPVITATQMLQSMETNPLPTRAEINDVANAVYDGTDAVMLSGETAQGKYPVEAVSMMNRILEETEKSPLHYFTRIDRLAAGENTANFVISAAVEAAAKLPLRAIVCNTARGSSARSCSAFRPRIPIYAFSYNRAVVRQLALTYGVSAGFNEFVEGSAELARLSAKQLLDSGKLGSADQVVMLSKNAAAREHNNILCIGELREFL